MLSISCLPLFSCEKTEGDDNDSIDDGENDNANDDSMNNGENDGSSDDSTDDDGGNNGNSMPSLGHEIGDLAMALPLDLVNGEGQASIENYRGKVVVVNFWGTWCDPCKSELPDFDRLAKEYSDEVVFYLVHSVQDKANAPSFITENLAESEMTFVYDAPLSSSIDMYYSLLGGKGYYPRTLVLDSSGVITFSIDRALEYDELKAVIEAAVK